MKRKVTNAPLCTECFYQRAQEIPATQIVPLTRGEGLAVWEPVCSPHGRDWYTRFDWENTHTFEIKPVERR